MFVKRFIYIVVFLFWSGVLHAEQEKQEKWFSNFRLEGFFSQTASYSSEHDFLSESRKNVSFDFWEAGLLLSSEVWKDLKFSSQLLGREVSKVTGKDFRVDYAFLSYPVFRSPDISVATRFGRIRSSFGLYNETRDIAHLRTGVVMPQSIYYDMTRNSFYSSDGIEAILQTTLADEDLSVQVLFSRPVEEDEELKEAASLNPDNFEGDKGLLAKLSYGTEYDGWRFAFTYYRPEYNVDAQFSMNDRVEDGLNLLLPDVVINASGSSFYSETMLTSLEYSTFDWTVTFEYSRHKFRAPLNVNVEGDLNSQTVPNPINPSEQVSAFAAAQSVLSPEAFTNLLSFDELLGYEENFYLQGVYRFNERWESYVRYDYSQPHTSRSLPTHQSWRDINAGIAFRPGDNWLMRMELHYIEGSSRLLKRDNFGYEDMSQYWTAGFFQLAYRW